MLQTKQLRRRSGRKFRKVTNSQDDRAFLEGERGGNGTVAPDDADRRAASMISVTVKFVSSEDRPSGSAPSSTTARSNDSELSYGADNGLAAHSFFLSFHGRRT